ncbi:ADP-ATP carrier protein 4 [Ecytonucleospora hepatopenaei]|uniref:ADP,ATP carrier protein n=1 Tax=Ecytonucleospora hepatopenaei TaxID=646526 RepID=A0A1W0E3S8_9MICR|nr:ADP-ATP carrier protein 4 [Ecytonucleospora hepatopenaei]WPJ73114.1 nucleotide transporter 4 [Ecytonucleospora hepatopenaei]
MRNENFGKGDTFKEDSKKLMGESSYYQNKELFTNGSRNHIFTATSTVEKTVNVDEKVMSFEEYEEEVKKVKNTKLGSFLTIIRSEYKRVFLSITCYFVVCFLYSFVRQFRDVIVFDVFDDPGLVNWFELISFIMAIFIFKIFTKICRKYGVNKGVDLYMISCASIFGGFIALIAFDRFVFSTKGGYCEELFNGNLASIRHVSIFLRPAKLLNLFFMTIFSVFLEVSSSFLISVIFMTYLSSNITHEQNQRYLFPILFGANMALFFSVYAVKLTVKQINKFSVASTSWVFYSIFILMLILLYGIIFGLKKVLDYEWKKPLYIGQPILGNLPQKNKKAENKTSFLEALKTIFKTKWLMGICTLALFYNISSVIVTSQSFYSYAAHADYYAANPLMINKPGFIPTKSNVSVFYKSTECIITSMATMILMLLPVFKKIFEIFGVLSFGSIVIFWPIINFAVCYFFAAINYPFTNNGNTILCNLGISKTKPNFEAESALICALNIAAKVSKYSFYDIIKESVSSKIDPQNKVFYKGIFDGIMPKTGKLFCVAYFILMTSILNKNDVRYFSAVSLIFLVGMGSVAMYSTILLHKAYKKAINTNKYL